jgi:hypothetical protein
VFAPIAVSLDSMAQFGKMEAVPQIQVRVSFGPAEQTAKPVCVSTTFYTCLSCS